MERGLMTIGEVTARLHVSVTFLRRLDAAGVVAPARSRGGHRRYSEAEVQRVRRALTLLGEGFPLTTLPRLVALEQEVARLRREQAAAGPLLARPPQQRARVVELPDAACAEAAEPH
ncbi:MAG: MerR family transcriptional regulator [Actinomycetes bacterium]